MKETTAMAVRLKGQSAELDTLRQRLKPVVEGPSRRLRDLVQADSPITYGVVQPGDPGDVPLVRSGDLATGEISLSALRTIGQGVHASYTRTQLKGGEVLVALVGVPGAAAVAPEALEGGNIARQVALLRFGDTVMPAYAAAWINSMDGQAALRPLITGSIQQVINLRDLRDVLMPVPLLSEQRVALDELDAQLGLIRRARSLLDRQLENLKALMDAAISEELRCAA
jgi:type I restriction enzyme S subunit